MIRWWSWMAAVALVGAAVAAAEIPAAEPSQRDPFVATVDPAVQPLGCPGPVTIPVGDISSGDDVLDSGSDDVTFEAVGDNREPADDGFRAAATAAAQVERVGSGDVAGISAAACTAPVRDQWLVGGDTTVGSSARLVLTNPADTSTEVTVTYFGALGPLESRSVVTVAAASQATVLVEGVAAEAGALAMRVTATGAGVAAALQDSRLDGFQAAGTDWVGPTATPGTRLVVPTAGTRTATGESVVRLLAPDGATVTMALAGEDGFVTWGGVAGLVLEPGVVTEVPVPAVMMGAIEIAADAPVTAAVRTRVSRTVTDGPADATRWDLTWVAAQVATDGSARAAIAASHVSSVEVYAARAGTFVLTGADGTEYAHVDLRARDVASVPLEVPPGTVLEAEGEYAWALTLSDSPGFVGTLSPRRTLVEPLVFDVTHAGHIEVANVSARSESVE